MINNAPATTIFLTFILSERIHGVKGITLYIIRCYTFTSLVDYGKNVLFKPYRFILSSNNIQAKCIILYMRDVRREYRWLSHRIHNARRSQCWPWYLHCRILFACTRVEYLYIPCSMYVSRKQCTEYSLPV